MQKYNNKMQQKERINLSSFFFSPGNHIFKLVKKECSYMRNDATLNVIGIIIVFVATSLLMLERSKFVTFPGTSTPDFPPRRTRFPAWKKTCMQSRRSPK